MDAETAWWRERALLLERRLMALGEEFDFDMTPPPQAPRWWPNRGTQMDVEECIREVEGS